MKELSETMNDAFLAKKEELKKDLWMFFMRAKGLLEIEDFSFIFLLLELKSKGYLENIDLSNHWEVKNTIVKNIIELKEEPYSSVINEIYQIYSKQIFDSNDFTITEFIQILKHITNLDFFKAIYPELFEFFLEKFINQIGKQSNSSLQPKELTQFCYDIIELPVNARIYNPFAGMASFAIFSPTSTLYYGQEKNKLIWAIGALRLLAHNKFEINKLDNVDAILDWAPYFKETDKSLIQRLTDYDDMERESFDLVISNPPIGLKLPDVFVKDIGYAKTVEGYFIEKGIEILNPNGSLVAIVSNSFLSNSGKEYQIRKALVENDFLEAIITLPKEAIGNTAIRRNIIVINKTKSNKGSIKFIDGSKFITSGKKKKEKLIDYSGILLHYNKINESSYKKIIPKEIILENDYSLNIDTYFLDISNNEFKFPLLALGEIIKHYKGDRKKGGFDENKYVFSDSLRNDRYDYYLNTTNIKKLIFPIIAPAISENCLLISTRTNSFKPTYFKSNGEKILIDPGILAFKIDETKVQLDYLFYELHSEYIIKQINAYRSGSSIGVLKKEDFLRIKIEVPPFEEQIRKLKIVGEANQTNKEQQINLEKKIYGLESEMKDQNNFLRHSISGSLDNLRGTFFELKELVFNKIAKNIPSLLELKLEEDSNFTFNKILSIMERDIEKIYKDTQRNSLGGTSLFNVKLEELDIITFLNEYINEVQNRHNCNFKISVSISEEDFIDDEGKKLKYIVNGNIDLLNDLFDNLIKNAMQHAFSRDENENNLIDIQCIFTESDKILISFMNNGKRIPDGFTYEMYTRKGSKAGENSGEGFGGWYINQILMAHYGELIEIIDEQGINGIGDIWATSIEFYLPIHRIESHEKI